MEVAFLVTDSIGLGAVARPRAGTKCCRTVPAGSARTGTQAKKHCMRGTAAPEEGTPAHKSRGDGASGSHTRFHPSRFASWGGGNFSSTAMQLPMLLET